jgi:hypothetical protein
MGFYSKKQGILEMKIKLLTDTYYTVKTSAYFRSFSSWLKITERLGYQISSFIV